MEVQDEVPEFDEFIWIINVIANIKMLKKADDSFQMGVALVEALDQFSKLSDQEKESVFNLMLGMISGKEVE